MAEVACFGCRRTSPEGSAPIPTVPTSQPILVRSRATGAVFEEKVLGRASLNWAYGTPSGRLFIAAIGKRPWFSALYGAYLKSGLTRKKIEPFARDFGVDLEEAVVPPGGFRSFNDFFIRKLRPSARPLAGDEDTAVLPADARHLAYPDSRAPDGFIVKGRRFTVAELLDDAPLAREFEGGALVISRLCPVDYHRYHFPCTGVAGEPRTINGPLFSVSPVALRLHVGYLAENKRVVTLIESDRFGRVAIVEIGATMVGAIRQSFTPGERVAKGQEKGWFEFGGSCVVTLFQPGRLRLCDDLAASAAKHEETLARMGEPLGYAVAARR